MSGKPIRRNSKTIGFSEDEYAAIIKAAEKASLYPRQLIMNLIRKRRV